MQVLLLHKGTIFPKQEKHKALEQCHSLEEHYLWMNQCKQFLSVCTALPNLACANQHCAPLPHSWWQSCCILLCPFRGFVHSQIEIMLCNQLLNGNWLCQLKQQAVPETLTFKHRLPLCVSCEMFVFCVSHFAILMHRNTVGWCPLLFGWLVFFGKVNCV